MTKSIITITADGEKGLDVRLVFEPAAKTTGPMTHDQAAAMAALKAIKAWAAGEGVEEVPDDHELWEGSKS